MGPTPRPSPWSYISTRALPELPDDFAGCYFFPFKHQNQGDIDEAVRHIRDLERTITSGDESRSAVLAGLGDAVALKPGAFGFSVDLKKAFRALAKR